ncbi:RsmB/NOP family class I SAM-dependent RNA methyltransferase [archaeon]|nr:RsmB/NOP family class I SAM-dependent RNA methyltransferase [archaeon]MBL7056779.1 RsmB/NOP family class I SAM-dependent RNA methyltransferase [Candidatus Woesearchaeota archaeon]
MSIFLRRYEELGEIFAPEEFVLKKSLRVNTLKNSDSVLIERLKKEKIKLVKIPFLDNGYFYESDFSLGATPEYLQGYYYLQEAASQLPAAVLDPKSDELVLDMSAAPGGKTTQLAAYMQNKGSIMALDNNVHRLESLRNNIERLGVTNTLIYKKDARFATDFKLGFDKILLDAPCSSNFADEENWFHMKSVEGFKERARLQKELLKAAVKSLKKGGVLVYSTCTLEPEENELNINWLLNKFNDLSLEEINLSIGDPGLTDVFGDKLNPEIKKCKRFWPHKTGIQGFFIAKIKKK